MKKLQVLEYEINIKIMNNENYVSLTDILRAKGGNFLISHWLRNRMTVEFLGVWEKIHNPNFNYTEFDIIKSQ